MTYAIMSCSRKIKKIREGWLKLCDTLTFYFAQLHITQIFGLGWAVPHSDFLNDPKNICGSKMIIFSLHAGYSALRHFFSCWKFPKSCKICCFKIFPFIIKTSYWFCQCLFVAEIRTIFTPPVHRHWQQWIKCFQLRFLSIG